MFSESLYFNKSKITEILLNYIYETLFKCIVSQMCATRGIYPKYREWGAAQYSEIHPVRGRLYRDSGRTSTEMFVKLPISLSRGVRGGHVDFPRDNEEITLQDLRSGREHCTVTGTVRG